MRSSRTWHSLLSYFTFGCQRNLSVCLSTHALIGCFLVVTQVALFCCNDLVLQARCPRHMQSVFNLTVDTIVMVNWQLSQRVSTDQYHLNVMVGSILYNSLRRCVFLKLSADQLALINWSQTMYYLTSSVMSLWICISLTSGMSPKTDMYCYLEYFFQFTRAHRFYYNCCIDSLILIHVLIVCSLRNDGKKKEEFLRRWERQLTEKQKELDSMYT